MALAAVAAESPLFMPVEWGVGEADDLTVRSHSRPFHVFMMR
jgi:hypothetical protein